MNGNNQEAWKRQSDFTRNDIKERLKNFKKLDSKDPEVINESLSTGMHIRWINYDKKFKRKTLKMGGVLQYVDPQGRYLRVKSMISNNIQPFSVQIKDSDIYYKEMIKKDPRYEELLKKFETEKRLNRFIDIINDLGSVENVDNILKYIDKHCKGNIGVLTREHQKMRHNKSL